MRRTLEPAAQPATIDDEPESIDDGADVLFVDDSGTPFSFSAMTPVPEHERRHLGFPFDVSDEFSDEESAWVQQQQKRLREK